MDKLKELNIWQVDNYQDFDDNPPLIELERVTKLGLSTDTDLHHAKQLFAACPNVIKLKFLWDYSISRGDFPTEAFLLGIEYYNTQLEGIDIEIHSDEDVELPLEKLEKFCPNAKVRLVECRRLLVMAKRHCNELILA